MSKKDVLLYNVYIVNHWKSITTQLLSGIPHEDLLINVSVDWYKIWKFPFIYFWFCKRYKPTRIIISINSHKYPEAKAFIKLRKYVDINCHSILTYMHGKGVTKPNNPYIKDWVELMRYFIIDKYELCIDAFSHGFKLYGINLHLTPEGEKFGPYEFSEFHFSGNFVSVNLELIGEKFFSTSIDKSYFGLEGFWGKLCSKNEVFCPFYSEVNHYHTAFPETLYKR